MRRLWVIDPSVHEAEDQCVAEVLDGWEGDRRVFRPSIDGDGPLPATGYDSDGVVLLGSAASVHEDLAWQHRLSEWLLPILDGTRPLPLLGVCYGHQLIAHLAGGRVGFMHEDRHKELGPRRTSISNSRLLPGTHELKVLASHAEIVEAMPEGYTVNACRAGVAIDGMEHAVRPIFAFQFHPEARDQFARSRGLAPSLIDETLVRDSRRLLAAFRRWVATDGP